VGTIQIGDYVAPADAGAVAERQELDWLLTSGVLGRSGNLARVLKYICEERFAGRAQHIKEYTIATEALGRRPDFDPNSDTIVRVTVHSLRKRLLEIYQNDGAERPMRLVIPPGHYDPRFIQVPLPEQSRTQEVAPPAEHEHTVATLPEIDSSRPRPASRRVQLWSIGIIAICLVLVQSPGLNPPPFRRSASAPC
jgi:hypothetical protein